MVLIMSIVVPLAVGLLAMYFARHSNLKNSYGEDCRITPIEFGVVTLIVTLVAVLLTVVWGPSAAKARAAAGYKEFWNGSIVDAWTDEIPCSRDGPCVHEYDCDPFNHVHTYSHTHGSGETATSHTHYEDHTHYHSCPYATHEFSYLLADNLGRTLAVAAHIFAESPRQWREGHGIPKDVPRGVPQRWIQSKQRLEAGDAEPATKVSEYTNFILPSEGTLYEKYSGSVERYLKAGLLPKHTANLDGEVLFDVQIQARKVQFVGMQPVAADVWQDRLMRFNAALGSERQGDLHVVVVPAGKIQRPDDYINALMAYWQSSLGKWGFPKNGIALVLGVSDDASKTEWSRAKTGMPEGNGAMLHAVQFDLMDKPFDPELVLGAIKAQPIKGKDGKPSVKYLHGEGVLDRIMFRDHPFKRACMKCEDADDKGTGYVYLKDSIPVPTGAKVMWFFVVLFVALVGWGVALFTDVVSSITSSTRRVADPPYSSSTYKPRRF